MEQQFIFGIDIGGSGIKGAPVDIAAGQLTAERYRIPTPKPSKPAAVAEVVAEIAHHFDWHGPIGCAFPAVIRNGIAHSAANVDKSWIGTNGRELFAEATQSPVVLLNDADAAAIAEMTFGAGCDQRGTVLLLTLGTGIGSAIFRDGVLLPNTEFGHMEFKRMEAEHYASDRVREQEKLSWKQWGKRLDKLLDYYEMLFSPDLIIIGGGVSKEHHEYFPYLSTQTPVVPAQLRNDAGIIGAALAARELA
jgi:polyphosphate glucokinase